MVNGHFGLKQNRLTQQGRLIEKFDPFFFFFFFFKFFGGGPGVILIVCAFVVFTTGRFVFSLTLIFFLVFLQSRPV